jgi:hypothetical protein
MGKELLGGRGCQCHLGPTRWMGGVRWKKISKFWQPLGFYSHQWGIVCEAPGQGVVYSKCFIRTTELVSKVTAGALYAVVHNKHPL